MEQRRQTGPVVVGSLLGSWSRGPRILPRCDIGGGVGKAFCKRDHRVAPHLLYTFDRHKFD